MYMYVLDGSRNNIELSHDHDHLNGKYTHLLMYITYLPISCQMESSIAHVQHHT